MKLFLMLISFTLVHNLAAVVDEDYRFTVMHINFAIESAKSVLPEVIQNIVRGKYTMYEMTLMLALPDKDIDTEKPMTDEDKTEKIRIQSAMLKEIKNKLRYLTYDLDESEYEGWSLSDFGKQRRRTVREAVKKLMVLLTEDQEKKDAEYLAMFEGAARHHYFFVDLTEFPDICRLLALNKAFKNPDAFREVVDAKVDDNTVTCIITYLKRKESRYRYIEEQIFEIFESGVTFHSLAFEVNYIDQEEGRFIS